MKDLKLYIEGVYVVLLESLLGYKEFPGEAIRGHNLATSFNCRLGFTFLRPISLHPKSLRLLLAGLDRADSDDQQ